MRIYALTEIGRKLARSTSNPDSPAYRVVAYLYQVGQSTTEQTAEFCGMSLKETSAIYSKLRHNKVVAEISGVTL